jgi:putative phosphoesterase
MKLAYISDLHIDAGPLGHAASVALPQLVQDVHPDVFVIGGDVASKLFTVKRFFKSFHFLACPKLFVPGNHDIWVSATEEHSSRDKYRRLLPDVCGETGFHFLPHNPISLNGIGFAGSLGWYDYSFRNPELDNVISEAAYRRKHYQGRVWNDRRYAKWRTPDHQVADEMATELDNDLAMLDGQSQKVVAVVHHLPFAELVRRSGDAKWDFFNAFMGSVSLGEVILRHSEVSLVLTGHTHYHLDTSVGDVRVVTSPLGYTRERHGNPQDIISDSILIIDL